MDDLSCRVSVVTLPPNGVALDEIIRQALVLALERSDGNQAKAAALLSVSARVMNYRMQVHGIPRRCDGKPDRPARGGWPKPRTT